MASDQMTTGDILHDALKELKEARNLVNYANPTPRNNVAALPKIDFAISCIETKLGIKK